MPFNRLFKPRAVVVVGVSKERDWGGTHYLETFKEYGFPRPVYPVNPKYAGEEIQGYKVSESISSLPNDPPIDLGIVAVPAKVTPQIVEELGQKGVLFAHIFSSGYSELGEEGHNLEKQLIQKAKKSHIRILGPNCMGIYNPKGRIGFTHGLPLEDGKVAFISQSGGIAGRHSHIGPSNDYFFSKVISLGNQIDLDIVDFLNYFRTDPDTKIISMYIENIKRNGNDFVQLLKKTTKEKPVIIWKGGKLEAGNSAVMSHTGGLAGNFKLWRSMTQQTGTILVRNFKELVEMIQTCLLYKIPKNRGTAIITGGGGPAVEMTDECELHGLEVPRITEKAQKMINEFAPEVNSNLTNPLEFGARTSQVNVIKAIQVLDNESHISSIMITSSPEHFISQGMDLDIIINSIASALLPNSEKNLIGVNMSFEPQNEIIDAIQEFRSKMIKKGIMIYDSIEAAAKSIYRLWNYGIYLNNQKK
ncbi:MAG: CoA-binding protein [Promethearchaeota archaeon]